ncbi:hypothetical protein LJ739_15525 [Aestuariibacter halophilus]|uniref:Uncharacterized protein n=1 Tax=Fluctibacter halophilus TaxID=226011 RepID=A0ABS8GAX8_9ALTE|nr:hypothetical protein [Aestuariibacter halophilus]MCC2617663.1 hypothetical protein [Aestuariibacter halophilus]
MTRLISRMLMGQIIAISTVATAQQLPTVCVELPTRTEVCDNLLYKRSPVDVPLTSTQKGEIVCICMTDFSDLRLPAKGELDIIDQQVSLDRAARALEMDQQTLLELIRR